MTAVPLPTGIIGASDVPKRQEYLNNLFLANGYLTRRPGITETGEVISSSGCRGSATWYVDENAYFVIGEQLYQLDSNQNIFNIGKVEGSGDVVFSLGQVNLVIIVKGGNGYIYNPTDGLSQITDPDFIASDSVDFIDGRHVYIPSDGSPAFYSEIDQPGNIDPLAFFDAEELPDLNRVTINISNSLYIGGSESFEIYRSTADVNTPFARRDGARIDVGYVSGIERYLSTFMFIGRSRDQSYAIHLMQQGSTQIISNEAINELLNDYTKDELLSVNSFSFVWLEHYFVGWNLPRHTIVFVDGNFVFFDSNLNGNTIGPWRGRSITFAHGNYYLGDRSTANIGRLSSSPDEYGSPYEWELKSFIRGNRESYFSLSQMTVDILTGNYPSTIGLAVSRDGRVFSDHLYKSLGNVGEYNRIVQWAGGLGVYESLMSFKLRGTGDAKISIEGVDVL